MKFCECKKKDQGFTRDRDIDFYVCGDCRLPAPGVRQHFAYECDVCDKVFYMKFPPDLDICEECEKLNV